VTGSIVSFLRIEHGRIFVASEDAELSGELTLGRTIPFERAQISSLDGINLIAHAHDPAEALPWQVRGAPSATLGQPGNEVKAQRPGAFEIAFEDVPPAGSRAFAIYDDRHWGETIPVVQGMHYTLAVTFEARECQIAARIEFLDAQKRVITASASDKSAIVESEDPAAQRALYMTVAPGGAAFMRCVLVARPAANAKAPGAVFWEPSLKTGRGASAAGWSPRPTNAASLYASMLSQKLAIYSARIDVRATADIVGDLQVFSGKTLVETVSIAEHCPYVPVDARIIGVEGSRVVYSATRFEGTLGLYIDGTLEDEHGFAAPHGTAEHGFYLPHHLLDGEPHLVQLRDECGVHVIALDYLLFPSSLTPWDALQRHAMPPLPGHLCPLASDRLRAFVANAEAVAEDDDPTPAGLWLQRQLGSIYKALVSGFEFNRTFFPLEFEVHDDPVVSIVIPVHNKYATTFHCLCALLFARNRTPFEVIVTDDGSSDETFAELSTHRGIQIARNPVAEGFIGACKAGAALARGEYILFLNNDTEPTAGWLDELVNCFAIFPRVGAAASKLLYPDGRLQDAGGIIWKTGNPWNYGRLKNPAEPKFSYSRQADYVSGAALITRRDLWEKIGGFADELRPAYFEDTWYSFAVREQGYKTIYCATSRVYHFEGVSNGKDVNTQTGLKRFQEINRPKFKRRWTRDFQSFGEEGKNPDLEKDRGISGRVLFVDWQCPRPDMDAGSYAAVQEMRLAKALGLKVSFLPLNLAFMGRYTEDLNRLGIETWHAPFVHSVKAFFAAFGPQFDAIYMTRYNVAESVLPFVKSAAPHAKTIFCLADLHFLRELRMAVRKGTGRPSSARSRCARRNSRSSARSMSR
jgi:GT2 family glycosyltransferase